MINHKTRYIGFLLLYFLITFPAVTNAQIPADILKNISSKDLQKLQKSKKNNQNLTTTPTTNNKKEPMEIKNLSTKQNINLSPIEKMFYNMKLNKKINTENIKAHYFELNKNDLKKNNSFLNQNLITKQYGYNIFSKTNTSLNTNVPVGDDYILGPGDTLIIKIWGKVDIQLEEEIDNYGNVTIPKIGKITLIGLKLKDAKKVINDEFSKHYVNFKSSITMGQLKTIKIFILGNVQHPGGYDISSFSTIFNALYMAGGPTKSGSMRSIKLRRNNKIIKTIDLYEYLIAGDIKQDPLLKPNDTIIVPPIGNVIELTGSVKTEGIFEVLPNSSLNFAINYLGQGYKANADTVSVKLNRFENNKRITKTLENTSKKILKTIKLKNGDSISIDSSIPEIQNVIKIIGNVYKPNIYEFEPTMTISSVINKAGGFLSNSNSSQIEVYRYTKNQDREVLFINLLKNPNFKIKRWDIIKISTESEVNGEKKVTIIGELLAPGKYPLFENMTVNDLIQLAKPTFDANLDKIELFRKDFNNKNEVISGDLKLLKDLKLTHNDKVFIKSKTISREIQKVIIEGEVNFPGTYITLPGEKIDSIIERAGGFTDSAFIQGIEFYRLKTKLKEKRAYNQLLNLERKKIVYEAKPLDLQSNIIENNIEQSLTFITEKEKAAKGRIVLNFINKNIKDSKSNIQLEDEDKLIIPKTPRSIQLIGGVNQPLAFLYEKNKSPKYYIKQAGGFTSYANKKKIFVFKANGEMVINPKKIDIGDSIYIQEKIKIKNKTFSFKNFSNILSPLVQALTAAALIKSL